MMQSLGTRLKYTEQYCVSNIIITHLGSSTVMPCHAYKPESQRVPQEYTYWCKGGGWFTMVDASNTILHKTTSEGGGGGGAPQCPPPPRGPGGGGGEPPYAPPPPSAPEVLRDLEDRRALCRIPSKVRVLLSPEVF